MFVLSTGLTSGALAVFLQSAVETIFHGFFTIDFVPGKGRAHRSPSFVRDESAFIQILGRIAQSFDMSIRVPVSKLKVK